MKTKSTTLINCIIFPVLLTGMVLTSCKKEEPVKEVVKLTEVQEFSTVPSDWVYLDGLWHTYKSAPVISPETAASGMVMVYIQYDNTWVPLPDNNGMNQTTFSFEPGMVTLLNFNQDGTNPGNPGLKYFKLVCIPHQMLKNPNLQQELDHLANKY